MAYNINITLLPAGTSFYIKAAAENPTVIDTEETVTLKFSADGTYYTLLKNVATGVSVTNATIDSWTCVSPYKEGTLIISKPTADVDITITGRQIVNPLTYGRPFKINTQAPIDTRLVLTKAQMAEIPALQQPDVYFCICKEDNKIYIWNSSFSKSEETGYFKSYDEIMDVAKAIDTAMEKSGGSTAESTEAAISKTLTGAMADILADDEKSTTFINTVFDNKQFSKLSENNKLSINGYADASQGQMLVKDTTNGLAWVTPVDETALNTAVAASQANAEQAGTYASQAGNSAIQAETAKTTAETINTQTMQYVNNKFWWGSIEEYNKLETLTDGTFYFVQL